MDFTCKLKQYINECVDVDPAFRCNKKKSSRAHTHNHILKISPPKPFAWCQVSSGTKTLVTFHEILLYVGTLLAFFDIPRITG